MSDIHRLKTLDSLERKGVYVNDFPGLIMDGKDISYYFIRFTRDDVFGPGSASARPEKNDERNIEAVMALIEAHNSASDAAGTVKELKVFYLDDQGYCLLGRVEEKHEPLRVKTKKREAVGERVFQLNLYRVFAAEGLDGVYQVRHAEVKGVYEGLQKFIASYLHGWIGLFRQYDTIKERTEVFRRFKPFKFPFFGTKESLKRTVFQIQLGARSPNGDEDFKQVSTGYGVVTLDDALAV